METYFASKIKDIKYFISLKRRFVFTFNDAMSHMSYELLSVWKRQKGRQNPCKSELFAPSE